MKTKHLLTGLVLPAVFAACTSEEIVPQQEVANVELGNRPVVGNVVFNFGETESRGTVADRAFNAIDFVKGEDGFGARIIDNPNTWTINPATATLDHASRKYTLTDWASSNYKYVNNGGAEWITDALMVEGNYMFYYPYSEANLSRKANEVVLPLEQTVMPAEEDGYRNPIKDLYEGVNPAIVGYTFLSATEQEAYVAPALHHIFAYPQITLTNDYKYLPEGKTDTPKNYVGKTLTVTKVVIQSNNFKAKGAINHTGLVTAMRDFSLTAKANTNMTAVAAGTWNADTKAGLHSAKTADIVKWATTEGQDGKITVEFEDGLTLAPEASYSFNIVAPAAQYSDMTFTVYFSDDKMIEGLNLDTNVLNFAPSKRYPKEAYNFPTNGTPSLKSKPGKLANVSIAGEMEDAKEPAELIDNIEEFEAFLQTIDNNTEVIEEVAELKDADDNQFVLATDENGVAKLQINAAVVELVNKYLSGTTKVKFTSPMQIADANAAVVLEKFDFDNNVEVLAGNVTVKNTNVAAGKTVTVKGGTLTIDKNAAGTLRNVIVEAGELVANKVAFTLATAAIETDEDGEATGVVGKITLKKDCGVVNANSVALAGGEIEIAAEAKMEVGASITTLSEEGTITNNGTLWVRSAFTIAEDIVLNQKSVVEFEGAAALKNEGTINNYKNLVVENEGTINMMDVKANLNVSGIGGDIYNTNLAYVKVAGHRDNQTVWYVWEEDANVATADAVDYYGSGINALEFKGVEFNLNKAASYTYKANGLAYISTVKFTTGSSLYVNGVQEVGMTKFFIEGSVSMSGRGLDNSSTVNLLNNATVEMAKGSVLTVTGITLNGGTAKDLTFNAPAPAAGATVTTTAEIVNDGVINLGTNGAISTNIKKTRF